MKPRERELVRRLRSQGFSLNEICEKVGVAKSSASVWTRDIQLTAEQIEQLRSKGMLCEAGREKYRVTMLRKREARYSAYHKIAEEEYPSLARNPDFFFGLALYIGEGDKRSRDRVSICNCDYRVLQKSIGFFRTIGIPEDRIRCDFALHPGLSEEAAFSYWQTKLGLSPNQFGRACRAVSRSSQGLSVHRQPYGTCRVCAFSTEIKQKLLRWMELALQ